VSIRASINLVRYDQSATIVAFCVFDSAHDAALTGTWRVLSEGG